MSLFLSPLFGLCLGPVGALAQTPNARKALAQARLIAESAAVTPGKPFTVALRMAMKPNIRFWAAS